MSINIQQACMSLAKIQPIKVIKEDVGINHSGMVITQNNSSQLCHERKDLFSNTPTISSMKSLNGFQSVNLLQDILNNKFQNLSHNNGLAKNDKIRLMIENSLSDESHSKVHQIFTQIEKLKTEEKLLLYLKLPHYLSNSNSIDPLRQPLNPLGNRTEIHQTIMWIKTHLEEDSEVSLQKQDVYDEYNTFCAKNSMKPLSTADFGKVMKQVYPRVRPRRLGTRGNSRYCYAGMRKKIKLEAPQLPKDHQGDCNTPEEMLGAASILIRDWAESILNIKFPNLASLGKYLVENSCVDKQSLAAICILNTNEKLASTGVRGQSKNINTDELGDAQLQLQEKLQNLKDIKTACTSQVQGKEICTEEKVSLKKSKKSVTCLSIAPNTCRQKKISKNKQLYSINLQSSCDSSEAQMSENPSPQLSIELPKMKNARKRSTNNVTSHPAESSPEKQSKLREEKVIPVISKLLNYESQMGLANTQPACIKAVTGSIDYEKESDISENERISRDSNKLINNCDNNAGIFIEKCSQFSKHPSDINFAKLIRCRGDTFTGTNILVENPETNVSFNNSKKLNSVDHDTLNDYLNGNNSQEQEEELLQYFQQSNSSSDAEFHKLSNESEQITNPEKVSQLSQLRIILQENFSNDPVLTETKSEPSTSICSLKSLQKDIPLTKYGQTNTPNNKRRVSFENKITDRSQDSTVVNSASSSVPPSPNTRRRIFNFTPISPGPHSPMNINCSKSNSENASPFVSPRNTPVPRSRSTVQGSTSRIRNVHKTISRSISCNGPYSENDIFAMPISGSEIPKPLNKQSINFSYNDCHQPEGTKLESSNIGNSSCPPLFADLPSQNQLLINYPSQENLQEIKSNNQILQQPTDKEISELFQEKNYDKQLHRSQSVPLHRMVNPKLLSPITTPRLYNAQNFRNNPIIQTPVPSEFIDFPSFSSSDNSNVFHESQLLTENNDWLNLISEAQTNAISNNMVESSINEHGSIADSIINSYSNENLDLNMLNSEITSDLWNRQSNHKVSSRSYPNTPLPKQNVLSQTIDNINSRSYPSTPLNECLQKDFYLGNKEPMLSNPQNMLNLQNPTPNNNHLSVNSMSDLIDSELLNENDAETDDLSSLGPFEGLNDGLVDVDAFTPLFNEVTTSTESTR